MMEGIQDQGIWQRAANRILDRPLFFMDTVPRFDTSTGAQMELPNGDMAPIGTRTDAPFFQPTQIRFNLGFQALRAWYKAGKTKDARVPFVLRAIIPNFKRPSNKPSLNPLTNTFSGGGPDALDKAQRLLAVLLTEWMRPNLGGIVIDATNESQERSVDVAESLVIVQHANNVNREYNTDNCAPRPRQWTIEGFISSAIPFIDEHFILRPSLVAQQTMLDAYAVARRPILYKSALCPKPVQVLIENYSIRRVVEGTGAYAITLNIKEFIAYAVPFYSNGNETNAGSPTTRREARKQRKNERNSA